MSRLRYCALLLLVWAGIYLPGLGSTELKGEEGRRIFPAITMLETGNWLVPYVSGEPFLRKPPLVNWAIAAAFKLTGVRNEWTARLPSAFCVLALGLVIIGTACPQAATRDPRWLGPPAAFIAAIFAITFAGLMAKARFAGAEIEGIYAPISGMAIVCWLAWWSRGCSPWLVWTVPGALLGLASLAKGPSLHLLFFYAIMLAVIGSTRRWRALFHPAHFLALALGAGIFAAWAIPYFRSPETVEALAVWKRQGIDRFTDSDFNLGNYLLNLPRGLSDLLPWLLFAPLLGPWFFRPDRGRRETEIHRPPFPVLRTVVMAAAIAFTVVLFVPGTLPRYVLPLGVAFALSFAAAVENHESAIRRWFVANRALAIVLIPLALAAPVAAGYPMAQGDAFDLARAFRAGLAATSALACCTLVLSRRGRLLTASWNAGASAMLLAAGMLLYAGAAIRWIKRGETLRPLAAQIDAAVPPGATLTLYDPGYQQWIFYLRSSYAYALALDAIPADTRAVLVRSSEKARRKFADKRPDLAPTQTFRSKTGSEYLLYTPRQPRAGAPPMM